MGDYIKPWRRKIGVVTLVLACLLMVGWLRSVAFHDEVRFHTWTDRTDGLVSTDSSIGWESRSGFEFHNKQSTPLMAFLPGNRFVKISRSTDPRNYSRWDWNWYWCGFAGGVAHYGHGLDEIHIEHHNIWIVPYWSIVIPLTVVSTWLLLSKTRSSKSGPTHV